MTDNNSPPPQGHINSPLFTKLPGEVRRMIYGEFFDGSRQEVRRHRDREDPTNRYTEFVRICMPFNRQFSLVRTCKAVYQESRDLYWCETAVKCAYMSFRANLNAIPFYARLRIRVLEGVVPVDTFNATGQMSLDRFLGHFPKLQYCQLHHHTVRLYCHHEEIPPENVLAESGSEALREIARSLNTENPPVFVQRIYVLPEKDRDRVSWAYVNHTEDRMYIAAKGSISDEEGFKKVTGPQQVEDAQKTQETEIPNDVHDPINFDEAIDVHEVLEAEDDVVVQETTMTDDATEVHDMDVYEDKLEGLDDVSEDDDEVYSVDE
ncbi:hypothetical protein FJTKL_14612 [Diaporthe vaccinii]|uniref:F-box domain-containing protein n=1 Tax=Diaporthe vaccinii TaxID=105482 RepID=A0ABR4E6Z4_9PEZI